ncbi:MAG: phosphoglycerate kinase [Patescibacteria group bacterium]
MQLRDIRSVKDLAGKRVLVRVDFNVPLRPLSGGYEVDPHGGWRIKRSLPTITYLMEQGAVVVLLTHVGRPKGMVREELRVRPIAHCLSGLLIQQGIPNEVVWTNFERGAVPPSRVQGKRTALILCAPDCTGIATEEVIDHARPGDLVLLENVRFHPEEEANDPEFARSLTHHADYFVNDQFSASHRKHASVAAITELVPSFAGALLIDEVAHLSTLVDNPAHPFTLILGGVKLETKLPIIKNMLPRVDALFIGGAAANTILSYQGKPVGLSMTMKGFEEVLSFPGWEKVQLPVDVTVAQDAKGRGLRHCAVDEVRDDEFIYDIGPQTVKAMVASASRSKLTVWNGPLGYFEVPLFARSSIDLAKNLVKTPSFTVIGGGDTLDLVDQAGVRDQFGFVSTGGGAMLAFLSGQELPGLKPLRE